MTNRLIYLIGQPGAGKSQLMELLTKPFDRVPAQLVSGGVAHDWLMDPQTHEPIGAELGIKRPLFGGTDALPSSIIEKAVPWIKTTPYPLILAEGARLANKRFIIAAIEGGYEVTLVLLDHRQADEWLAERAERIGRAQNPAWVKGRLTASRNLAEWAESEAIEVVRGHPDDLAGPLSVVISEYGRSAS